MKVNVERLPESRVQLEIEVDPERVEKTLEDTLKKVAKNAKIAGFRPGKAPRPLIMQRIGGRTGLIRESLDAILPDAYNTAIEEQGVDAIDQPDLEILELEPVRFKATVPVRPTIEIDDFRSISVKSGSVDVTDDDVAEEVLAIRQRLAIHVPADRAAAWNDVLTADIKAAVEGETIVDDQGAEFPLRESSVLLVPGLAEAFVGMSREESKSLDIEIPEDFSGEDMRGKTALFELTVREIKEEELLDEDDDLARQVAEDLESLDALRERVREQLQSARESAEEARLRTESIEQLLEIATLDFPRVLVEREMDNMVRDGIGNDASRYEQYLQTMGRTHEEFRETFRDDAVQRVKASLVLGKIAEMEDVSVSEEDIDGEVERLAGPMGDEAARFRELFAGESARESIKRNLETQRTFDLIIEAATSGEATAEAEEEKANEETPPTPKSRKPRAKKKKEPTE